MQDILLPETLPVESRKQTLQDSADKVDYTKYMKPLSTEELDIKREKLSDNYIQLSEHEDELKEITAGFKEKMDPLKRDNKELLQQIKTKQELVQGKIYQMANFESGFMESYDEDGRFIGSRRLLPDEKQGRIFSIPKAINQ